MSQVLLVIDIQSCYINTYKNQQSVTHLIDNTNRHIEDATRKGIPIILIEHEFRGWLLTAIMKTFFRGMGLKGSEDFPTDPRVKIKPDKYFIKTKGDSLTVNKLEDYLKANKISQLILLGQDGNECIRATTLGSLRRGYTTYILEDAVGASNEAKWRKNRDLLIEMGAKMLANIKDLPS